ncbi:MAG TPA: hypothetical protein VFR31_00755 [Thermoanaerobaculia bacterium]|nr:hypothetical protein [Thermoanaerobaculia bacterium]
MTSRRQETWLFAALIAVHLLPIWLLPMAPTQDGPAHLSMAHALRQYDAPEGSYLREYFVRNPDAVPTNWFVFFLLGDVLRFLPLPLARNILLSAYVILLPLSARYALRPRSRFLAFLSFPFTYNLLLNLGFYNFCFSLPAFLVAVGFWMKRRGRLEIHDTAILTLLILWTWFCHPVTLAVLVGTLLTLASWRALRLWDWKALVAPVLASAPAVILILSFLQDRIGAKVTDMTFAAKARQLAALYSLVSLDTRLVFLSGALSALLGVLVLMALARRSRKRHLLPGDGLFFAVLTLVGIYFVAPNEMGQGGFVTHRLNLFPFLVLILWLGTFSFPEALRTAIRSAGTAISLAFLAAMLAMWAGLNVYLTDILTAAPHVEPRSTLLTLSFSNAGEDEDGSGDDLTFRTWPFVHAGSHLAARVPLVDLALYEAHEDYFPLTYRPERDPYLHLVRQPLDLEAQPPRVDLSRYPGRIDYVLLVWPNGSEADVRRQLAGYERVHRSPEGLAELWQYRRH